MDPSVFNVANAPNAAMTAAAMLMSFILASVICAIYRWTYQGLSYSRSFVHTQILASVIVCSMILAIGSNVAAGLGILGTLAIVRFRTPIRDPRDIIFLLASICMGIACGAGAILTACIGCAMYSLAAVYLHWSPFASRRNFEGLLRFMMAKDSECEDRIFEMFDSFCSSTTLVAMREAVQGDYIEYAYQIRLKDPSYQADLIEGLTELNELNDVNLMMQRSTVEL